MYKKLAKDLEMVFDSRESENIALYVRDSIQLTQDNYESILNRLIAGEPVQYVCETAFFYGYKFYVNSDVLIPRAETEELVYMIEQDIKPNDALSILDIGCGSGCIITSIKSKRQELEAYAIDVSSDALTVTKLNAERLKVNISFEQCDILNEYPFNQKKFDIIVSNPPYILEEEIVHMGKSVVKHEPSLALFVENDALIFYKHILKLQSKILKPGGKIYFEINALRMEELKDWLEIENYNFEFFKDLQGNWRILKVSF